MSDDRYSSAPGLTGETPWGEPRAATKKEFLNLADNVKLKKNLRGAAIICYVCAALTLVAGLFIMDTGMLVLLDVAILVILGLGIQLKQSKVCAVLLTLYAAASMIITYVQTGKLTGYLVLLAGIYALSSTFQLDKQWKAYQSQSL